MKRLRYLSLLAALFAFFLTGGTWLSSILLITALALPFLSLLLSLGAIRGLSLAPTGGEILEVGQQAELWLMGSCSRPMPPFRGSIRLESCFTHRQIPYRPEKGLDTHHCGGYIASVRRGRVWDYMELFSFPIRNTGTQTVIIRPAPVVMDNPPQPENRPPVRWKPKPGGGFSDNHELRPFRPGDDRKQIHWKLSAKVGSLILREPMLPLRGKTLLTLILEGDPEELDRKLGIFLWLGRYLLERAHPFELRALTGQGTVRFSVDSEKSLLKALDALLLTDLSRSGHLPEFFPDAEWHYHIGGQHHESET